MSSQHPVVMASRAVLLATGYCLLATSAIGCMYSAHRENSPAVVNVEPVKPDEAMQRREWEQVTASYPNGAVVAGPTQFNSEPKRGMPESRYYFADTTTFIKNMALLPYNLYKHPQGGEQISPGETVGPTYTAQPVMPEPMVYQPSTPPVIEGAQPTTPPVVEPGAMPPPAATETPVAPAAPETPAATPAPEAPAATPTTPAAPAPAETPAAPAPININPAPAPAEPAPAATPAPVAPTPVAPAPTPAPAVEPTPAPGEVAPSTPRIVEPPPPEATKNLAPPAPKPAASEPNLNK